MNAGEGGGDGVAAADGGERLAADGGAASAGEGSGVSSGGGAEQAGGEAQNEGEGGDGEEGGQGDGVMREEEEDIPLYHPLLERELEARMAAGRAVRSVLFYL